MKTLAQEARQRMKEAPRKELNELAFFELLNCEAWRTSIDGGHCYNNQIGQKEG